MRSWILGLLAGLLLAEVSGAVDVLACWVMRRAAVLWTSDRTQSETYAEEWSALIADRPGSLLKLVTALTFVGRAAWKRRDRLASTRRDALTNERGSLEQAITRPERCRSCGRPRDVTDKFCGTCGIRLDPVGDNPGLATR